MASTVLAGLAFIAATAGISAAEQSDPPPFTLAIVRRDSVIVPVATWTGKAWTNTWPVPSKAAETPITLDAVPKRWWGKTGPVTEWHALIRGAAQETLRPSTPTWFLAHCEQGTGMRSTYTPTAPPPPPPPIVQPYPKDGVAASAPVKFQPIGVLSESSAVWKAVAAALSTRITDDEERLLLKYAAAGWRHPERDPQRRQQVPLSVEALYRSPSGTNGQFLYYFEAVKRYPPSAELASTDRARGTGECEVVTFVSGWFRAGNSPTSITLDKIHSVMTTCDYAAADVMLPMAYLTWKGSPLWIAQFSGWGRESYVLLHAGMATDPEVLFQTPGGSCPFVGR